MYRFAKIVLPLSLACAVIAPQAAVAADPVQTSSSANAAEFMGKMLYGPAGERLAAVYRVSKDGTAQIILNGKLVSVPADTLSATDGKLMTSKSKRDLLKAR